MSADARFWARVHPQPTPKGCWLWLGQRGDGYGLMPDSGRRRVAHLWLYERVHGPVTGGQQLDHLCRNRACVNPGHLEQVPPVVNYRRGESPWAKNGRKTHCPRGHEYTAENIYRERGSRRCLTCKRERDRLRWRNGTPTLPTRLT